MGRWVEAQHPRGRGGRFTHRTGAAPTASPRAADVTVHSAHGPRQMSPAEFEATVPQERRIYRGVSSAAGAQAGRDGHLGQGDYGKGLYFTPQPEQAVSYAQKDVRNEGTVIRAAFDADANVQQPPQKVLDKGSAGIDRWADANQVDVVDLGYYKVVRNPDVLTFDGRDYDLDEATVLAALRRGYDLDDYPPDAIRRVRAALRR